MRGFRLYVGVLRVLCSCRFDLSALDALRDQGPMVIAANHPSLLDAVMINSRLPNAVCVMKADLMDNPLFGSAARLARYVRNDGILQIIAGGCEALQQGTHLVLFPEGSRTVHFPVDPLQPTTGMIARRAGAPWHTADMRRLVLALASASTLLLAGCATAVAMPEARDQSTAVPFTGCDAVVCGGAMAGASVGASTATFSVT